MKIHAALAGISLLAIETSPFIYFVEKNPVYVDRVREIFKYLDNGLIAVITSAVTLTETLTKPIKDGNGKLEKGYRDLFAYTQNLRLYPIEDTTADLAANLRARYNLKTPDALQVSVAIESSCQAFP